MRKLFLALHRLRGCYLEISGRKIVSGFLILMSVLPWLAVLCSDCLWLLSEIPFHFSLTFFSFSVSFCQPLLKCVMKFRCVLLLKFVLSTRGNSRFIPSMSGVVCRNYTCLPNRGSLSSWLIPLPLSPSLSHSPLFVSADMLIMWCLSHNGQLSLKRNRVLLSLQPHNWTKEWCKSLQRLLLDSSLWLSIKCYLE